jgi:peptidyl-prolyl cis-trans isomerase A (cyclophilin A)
MVFAMTRFLLTLALACAALAQTPRKPGLYATFQTSEGNFTAVLFEKETPQTVANFVGLAEGRVAWRDPQTRKMVKKPLYQNFIFHRVVPHEAIQAGDPTGVGNHNCGVRVPDEFLPGLRFDKPGKLAMANSGQPDSGGCQFFISANITTTWTGKYTIFGQVVEGMDVVEKISRMPVRDERLVTPVKLVGVVIERVRK